MDCILTAQKKKKGGRHADPDEGGEGRGGARGKQFKSKAIIEDSDEEADDYAGDGGDDDADARSDAGAGETGENTAAPSPGGGDDSE